MLIGGREVKESAPRIGAFLSLSPRRSALRGTKGATVKQRPANATPAAVEGRLGPDNRLMAKRPSDRRSPGRNPGPQGAFEVSMINVSCNSH